jgi:hypothetical protein
MYKTNREYRKVIREFFEMKCVEIGNNDNKENNMDSDDEETIDELLYDSESVEKKMNQIFEETRSIDVFVKIYEIAAGHMLSVDLETGLAVLLSYDYFSFFYAFYTKFRDYDVSNLESMKEYCDLMEKIKK